MNSRYFCDAVVEEAEWAMMAITGESWIEGMMISMDNCELRNSAKTIERLEEFQLTKLPHLLDSLDISPWDFWFVRWNKNEMSGQQFHSADDPRAFLLNLWRNLDPSTLISVYHEWITRFEQVVAMNGDYYSK
jgi:hypothetical protein